MDYKKVLYLMLMAAVLISAFVFGRVNYISDWTLIFPDQTIEFNHNLGAMPMNVQVFARNAEPGGQIQPYYDQIPRCLYIAGITSKNVSVHSNCALNYIKVVAQP